MATDIDALARVVHRRVGGPTATELPDCLALRLDRVTSQQDEWKRREGRAILDGACRIERSARADAANGAPLPARDVKARSDDLTGGTHRRNARWPAESVDGAPRAIVVDRAHGNQRHEVLRRNIGGRHDARHDAILFAA